MDNPQFSKQTIKKLNSLGVTIVYFFGSRSQGTFLNKSDYDIGVVFDGRKNNKFSRSQLFQKVYKTIEMDVPDKIDGPKLDISFLQDASPALQASAIKYGRKLYQKNPTLSADYEENVVNLYDDYFLLKKEYEQATLTAFKS